MESAQQRLPIKKHIVSSWLEKVDDAGNELNNVADEDNVKGAASVPI